MDFLTAVAGSRLREIKICDGLAAQRAVGSQRDFLGGLLESRGPSRVIQYSKVFFYGPIVAGKAIA